jgi:cell division transport system permease protein
MAASAKLRILPELRDSGGILPWVIGVMVYLSALAIAGGFGVRSAASGWTSDLTRRVTIQVSETETAVQTQKAGAIVERLKAESTVEEVRRLSDAELGALLDPWLGEGSVNAELPVPAMIDVTFKDDSTDMAALSAKVRAIAPSAIIDTHQQWLGQLSVLTRSINWIANLIVLLVALATVALVVFGTQAGLAAHKPTIEILHLMGAEDGMIADEFQKRFLVHGFFGGVGGLILALITIFLLGALAQRAGQGFIASVSLSWLAWLALLFLPILAALLTMLAARLTVLRALRDIL